MERDRSQRLYAAVALTGGLVLCAAAVGLALLSPEFEYGSPLAERPFPELVALLMAAGTVYLGTVYALARLQPRTRWLIVIMLLGLVMRAPLFFSQPIQEDDFYRYLWDGGVAAHGFNPYRHAPQAIRDPSEAQAVSPELQSLADDAGHVFDRINHPELATVYPPTAQAGFALAHVAAPWSLNAWRAVILLFDIVTVAGLLLLLRAIGKPLHFAAIYWWNPVLLKEAYNSAHMDLLILPFALAALWFTLRSQPIRSACALVLAIGAKLWPVLLAPLLLRSIQAPPKRLVMATLIGAVIVVLLMAPIVAAGPLGAQSGFTAYGDRWEMNDALFMVVLKGARALSDMLRLDSPWPDRIARAAAAFVVLAILAWLTRKPMQSGSDLANRIVIVLGVAFMLSPTQFPWYYLWILPFLALSPRPSLLVLSAMLPLYYLKFYYQSADDVAFFHNRIVWLEYAPTLILATTEALPMRRLLAPKHT